MEDIIIGIGFILFIASQFILKSHVPESAYLYCSISEMLTCIAGMLIGLSITNKNKGE